MGKLIMIGQMDNSDGTLEKDNRVYDVEGCSPTITCGGGQRTRKDNDDRQDKRRRKL
jgi:hypothetical protein